MQYKLDRGSHSVYSLQYHLVQVIKYRKKALDNEKIVDLLKLKINEISTRFQVDVIDIGCDLDHFHMIFKSKPTLDIPKYLNAINTQGKFYETVNPRPDKYWNSKADAIQARRDHCVKGSKRWERLNQTKNKITRKCSNQIKDIQHKFTRKMVDNTRANTIIVGDLDVKEMAQYKNVNITKKAQKSLNRSTQNNGYLSQFVGFLTYKAALIGKKVIEIDERYTSKKCYVCGKKHDMPLWKRTMECD